MSMTVQLRGQQPVATTPMPAVSQSVAPAAPPAAPSSLHRPIAPKVDLYGYPGPYAALHAVDDKANRVTLFFDDRATLVVWLTDAIDAAREAQVCDCGKPAGHAGQCEVQA